MARSTTCKTFFMVHHVDFNSCLNLKELLPHLNEQQLLTSDEMEKLMLPSQTRQEKTCELVKIMCIKGDRAPSLFVKCVRDAAEHLPHSDLADKLENWLINNQSATGITDTLATSSGSEPTSHSPQPSKPSSLKRQHNSDQSSGEPSKRTRTSYPDPQSCSDFSQQCITSPLQVFADNLRTTYTQATFFRRAAGPASNKMQYISLALIKKQKANHIDREQDKFLKSTLHDSADDIIKKKEQIQLDRVFAYGEDQPRKLVLVEGAPGVGKTMLALEMCRLWAKGEFLNEEYDILVLVTLRRFQKKFVVTLKDIINIVLEGDICDKAVEQAFRSQGDRTLIILEGWDELPPELREEGSFFFDIVVGNKLPKVSVLVTSRPSVTADLYDYMDERHIEVLGFDTEQITQYIQLHGGEMSKTILGHLNKFPNLKALAHIPLTLSIICHVARMESALPHTLTELYEQYICNILYQNCKKQSNSALNSINGITSLSKLPPEIKSVFNLLCILALDSFKQKKFVYSREDLQRVGLNSDNQKRFDGYGLLNTPINSDVAGFDIVYQFNHLSIQEFLAAYGIQKLDRLEQVRLLREFRDDMQFRNVWKFFSGITKLIDEDFQEIMITETGKANRAQIFLLHCVYEANTQAISEKAAEQFYRVLNLSNMFLNTTDCLCAAHMVTSAGGEWTLDFRGCNIGDNGLSILKMSLVRFAETNGVDGFKISSFNLTHNRITASAISHLADIISCNIQLEGLTLSYNPIGDEGIGNLATALESNKTVTILELDKCEITSVGAYKIAKILEGQNKFIKEIHFRHDNIGDEGVERIALALEKNETITEMTLTDIGMTSVGLTALSNMAVINGTFETLRIDRNNLQPMDCELIANIIERNNSLKLLDLTKNPIGDQGFHKIIDALIAKPTSSLGSLGVYGCGITSPKGIEKLVTLFSVTQTLDRLQLGYNRIDDEGAKLLGQALQQNTSKSVTTVVLENTHISNKGKKMLQEICDSLNAGRDDSQKVNVVFTNNSLSKKLREDLLHI